jgi:hypothetical protein
VRIGGCPPFGFAGAHNSIFRPSVIATTITLSWRLGLEIDAALRELIGKSEFYATYVGLIIAIRLFCARYWVWRNERRVRIEAQGAFDVPLKLSLTPKLIDQMGSARVCIVSVENEGARNINNCQVTVDDHYVCAPFDLRPDEPSKHIAIFHFVGPHGMDAVIHPWSKLTGDWIQPVSLRLRLQKADYEIRVVADDSSPQNMRVQVRFNGDWSVTRIALQKSRGLL